MLGQFTWGSILLICCISFYCASTLFEPLHPSPLLHPIPSKCNQPNQVSFIRRRSQASSPNSTSSTASRSSVVSPKLNVAQIYVRAESPSGMCDMHFRWPGAPLERKNISWDGCDIVDSGARDASFCGDIQQADNKKTFVKEKHPFALFQI